MTRVVRLWIVSKQYRPAFAAGHFFPKILERRYLSRGGIVAPGVLKRVAVALLPIPSGWVSLAANRSRRRPQPASSLRRLSALTHMKAKTTQTREMEPVGIVISRGLRTEPAPMILAFEWGPAPELSPANQDHKAA